SAPVAAQPTTAQPKSKKFIQYIHDFRGIAIIYVVAAHVLVKWEDGSVTGRVMEVVWQNSTILFLFIAGYLFQHLSARFEYKDYLIKKFQNVICPYLILSLPLVIYRLATQDIPGAVIFDHPDFATWSKAEQAGYYMLHGAHLQPLWFIPMITLYYLISPVLLYIDKHPKLYYLLLPLFALSFIITRSVLSDTLAMAVHFLSVYVFGMFLSRYKNEFLEFAKKFWLPLTVLPIAALVATYFATDRMYDRLDFLHKVLFCGFYIYWLWRLEKYIPKWVDILATYSFGIFFVHYFFVLLVRGLSIKFFHREVPGNIVFWLLSFIIIMVLSVLTLKAAQKILGKKSKYFVGV
ncbi:MAG: acyltransferase, partial [Chitinophagaceae bacterium]